MPHGQLKKEMAEDETWMHFSTRAASYVFAPSELKSVA